MQGASRHALPFPLGADGSGAADPVCPYSAPPGKHPCCQCSLYSLPNNTSSKQHAGREGCYGRCCMGCPRALFAKCNCISYRHSSLLVRTCSGPSEFSHTAPLPHYWQSWVWTQIMVQGVTGMLLPYKKQQDLYQPMHTHTYCRLSVCSTLRYVTWLSPQASSAACSHDTPAVQT